MQFMIFLGTRIVGETWFLNLFGVLNYFSGFATPGGKKDKALLFWKARQDSKSKQTTARSLFFNLENPRIQNSIDQSAPILLSLNSLVFFQVSTERKVVAAANFCQFVMNCCKYCFVLFVLSAAKISASQVSVRIFAKSPNLVIFEFSDNLNRLFSSSIGKNHLGG